MNCYCKEFQEYWPQIIAAQVFCANQIAGPKYTGTAIKFCPWCATDLDKLAKYHCYKLGCQFNGVEQMLICKTCSEFKANPELLTTPESRES